jgi:hypothetical protein
MESISYEQIRSHVEPIKKNIDQRTSESGQNKRERFPDFISKISKELFDENSTLERLVIVSKSIELTDIPYCLIITRKMVEYREGSHDDSKSVVCNFEDGSYSVNKKQKGADYERTFYRYLMKVFKGLSENNAVLYEEKSQD